MLFSHLYVIFGEMSIYIFYPFFDWIVCFLWYCSVWPVRVFCIIISYESFCLQIFSPTDRLLSSDYSSVNKSFPTLYEFMDSSTSDFPVFHYLLKFAQTYVQHFKREKIFPNEAINKRNLQNIKTAPASQYKKNQTTQFKKWVEDLNRHFSKKNI